MNSRNNSTLFSFPVTALREHWDEANARVLQRKAQLDAMLGDSQRYEARRREADAWLARMETRLAAMTTPGHTADVLDQQLREQKVPFHTDYIKATRVGPRCSTPTYTDYLLVSICLLQGKTYGGIIITRLRHRVYSTVTSKLNKY